MKKVIFLFCILIILSACKGYEVTEIEKTTDSTETNEEIATEESEEIEEEIPLALEEKDLSFNLPADEDTEGWTQTLGPLGGVVIKMIAHDNTIWTYLYS